MLNYRVFFLSHKLNSGRSMRNLRFRPYHLTDGTDATKRGIGLICPKTGQIRWFTVYHSVEAFLNTLLNILDTELSQLEKDVFVPILTLTL